MPPELQAFCICSAAGVISCISRQKILHHSVHNICRLSPPYLSADTSRTQSLTEIFLHDPCLQVGDQVHLARWLLHRLGEDFGIVSTFNPKPVKGDWNGECSAGRLFLNIALTGLMLAFIISIVQFEVGQNLLGC